MWALYWRHTRFLSTPPSRVATHRAGQHRHGRPVSIHATLAGGDLLFSQAYSRFLVSIHATLAGGDFSYALRWQSLFLFLSTPPSRVATLRRCGWNRSAIPFLSTPPSRVATYCNRTHTASPLCFYPRHPRGWRLPNSLAWVLARLFLSTPPSRVATTQGGFPKCPFLFLSTPPSRVATWAHTATMTAITFLSTPPARVATRRSFRLMCQPMFLSTPPSRVATGAFNQRYRIHTGFYPRHPRGWRRPRVFFLVHRRQVSIHATLAGGDGRPFRPFLRYSSFYPRHPRGWRQKQHETDRIFQRVSIHATLAGGDRLRSLRLPLCAGFYPRHPRGWRRGVIRKFSVGFLVSIHATLAGGDLRPPTPLTAWWAFLSTPPSRVATTYWPRCTSQTAFLSTPPSRVATGSRCASV